MSTLHAVFRSQGGSWEAYSAPVSVYAGGRTREQAREEFREAAEFHFGDAWPDVDVVEHIERAVSPGVFARTAIDRRSLDRQDGERVLRASLSVPHQVRQIQESAVATTGDHVFVVCVPVDRLDWVTSQITSRDSVQVCVASPRGLLWWTTLSGVEAAGSRDGTESLGDLGLGPARRSPT